MQTRIGGRVLLQRFWLAALATCLAIVAGGWWLMDSLEANRRRNEVALTFSHLAEGFARLELAMIAFLERGRPQDRVELRNDWQTVLEHFEQLARTLSGATGPQSGSLSLRAVAVQMSRENRRGWDPSHDHDLDVMMLPPQLESLWESEVSGTRVADAVAETLVLLAPIVRSAGPATADEHALVRQLRHGHDRHALVDALHQGSVLMIGEFSRAGRGMRVSLVLAAIGAVVAVATVTAVLLAPLAGRVEADHAALALALDLAQTADKTKAQFLATMSHELRTPLNGIVGMAALLGDSRLDTRQAGCVDTIRVLAGGLASVIDDILEYGQLDSGRLRLDRLPFALEQIGRAPIERLRSAAAVKGLEMMVCIEPSAPARLVGDLARLNHVVANVLSNAVKFTRTGYIALSIGTQREPGGRALLRIAVTDTGPGVRPEDAEAIFERFRQGDQSATRTAGGVGLGLAICRTLMELMGGRIGVVPNPAGPGACFWIEVSLPIADDSPAITPHPDLVGRRVAVISPLGVRQRHLEVLLGALGAEAVAGEDSAMLWEDPDAVPFDAVVIDHMPPGHDASLVIEALAEAAPETVAVVLTATDTGWPDGVAGVVTKPASPAALATAVCGAVARHDARRIAAAAAELTAAEQVGAGVAWRA